MKRRFIPPILSILAALSLATLLVPGVPPPAHAQASLAPAAPPQVTVYLKNYWPEYDLATAEFLAAQFQDPDSAANGLVGYTVVTGTLTPEALAGSAALVVDLSADKSLTAAEATVIHDFVNQGGRVGLFTFPRYYWDHEGPNPAAYQSLADLFGNATVGDPNSSELTSGESFAAAAPVASGLFFNHPYAVPVQPVGNYDQVPFMPITARGTVPLLISEALGKSPVAVANSHGILVTNSIGDLVQGGDATLAYREFVVDAIVWLANGGPLYRLNLPMVVTVHE